MSRWGVRCLRSRSQKGVENVTVLSSILYPLSSSLPLRIGGWVIAWMVYFTLDCPASGLPCQALFPHRMPEFFWQG